MKTITMKQARRLKKRWEKETRQHNNCRGWQEKAKKEGFRNCDLGTGQSARTFSGAVDIQDIKSRKYLHGKYLVLGTSNISYGKGTMYRGYVVKIEG